ncbi:MAG: Ig-like domain-containing protein [Prevotella sp.]|nr:Ig-like domain-containing protein [Prevotella sp.]
MGETFTAPTLTNPYSVEVSWSSSDESVATVDASGNVTLVAAGTTVITATFAGNDDYKAGAASYTLTVEGEATGISAVDANEGGVEVYSLTGIQMGTFSSAQEARSSLPKGYYVFVEGNREYKVFVR